MTRIILLLVVFVTCCFTSSLSAQDENKDTRFEGIGLSYAGELGLHPGVRIDANIRLSTRYRWRSKQTLLFRPTIGYFFRPYYTNNFVVLPQIVSKSEFLEFGNIMCFYEIYGQMGLLRYQYIGDVYETQADGSIEEVNFAGDNAFVIGVGISLGVKSLVTGREFYLGFDYNKERTPDELRTNLLFINLGCRLPFQKNTKDDKKD